MRVSFNIYELKILDFMYEIKYNSIYWNKYLSLNKIKLFILNKKIDSNLNKKHCINTFCT